MTPEQVDVVRATFAKIAPSADQAGLMFYERLFELEPSLRSMFANDIAPQSKMLMQMIRVAVNALDRLDTIVPAVEALGVRHAGYGVRAEHFDIVAVALLDTLRRGLGPVFTPEAEAAWTQTYVTLADVMMRAAATSPTAGTA